MMEGHKLFMGGWLHNGSLDKAELHGGFLQNLDCTNDITMYKTITVDDNVLFRGMVVVNDTLIPNLYGGGAKIYDLDIEGNLINHGIIMDNYFGEMLQIYISGNLTNNGDWMNYLTHVYVSNEQYIELIDDKPIEGTMEFDAVIQSETYQWYYDDNILDSEDFEGETSQVLKWLVPVSSQYYGSFHCETGTKETIGILIKHGSLGVEEVVQELSFDVYPNPCQDEIHLRYQIPDTKKAKSEIMDIKGRVVKSIELQGEENTVHVSDLPAGVYFIKLQTEAAVGVRKIIKK
jgi:hypothetical protein